MRHLENHNRLHGIISWKETFAVKRRDHCREQENKILKGQGGVSCQLSNSNTTNSYFMTALILSQIYSEMLRDGRESNSNSKSHHQLVNAYIIITTYI